MHDLPDFDSLVCLTPRTIDLCKVVQKKKAVQERVLKSLWRGLEWKNSNHRVFWLVITAVVSFVDSAFNTTVRSSCTRIELIDLVLFIKNRKSLFTTSHHPVVSVLAALYYQPSIYFSSFTGMNLHTTAKMAPTRAIHTTDTAEGTRVA